MSSERPDQFEVGSRDAMARKMVRLIAESARTAIQERDVFTLAIPGGSIADAVIPPLIVQDLPWEKVHVFWVDERAVPLADVNSNAGHAFRIWQATHFALTAHLHVMFGDPGNDDPSSTTESTTASNSAIASDMELAANTYSRLLDDVCGNPVTLDVALLGVGEDGHIASLFPGHVSASDVQPSVIAVIDSPKPPAERLSLSYHVIASAREVIVAAFGDGKAVAMQQALENDESQMPVARIIREARSVHTFLDAASASALRKAWSNSNTFHNDIHD